MYHLWFDISLLQITVNQRWYYIIQYDFNYDYARDRELTLSTRWSINTDGFSVDSLDRGYTGRNSIIGALNRLESVRKFKKTLSHKNVKITTTTTSSNDNNSNNNSNNKDTPTTNASTPSPVLKKLNTGRRINIVKKHGSARMIHNGVRGGGRESSPSYPVDTKWFLSKKKTLGNPKHTVRYVYLFMVLSVGGQLLLNQFVLDDVDIEDNSDASISWTYVCISFINSLLPLVLLLSIWFQINKSKKIAWFNDQFFIKLETKYSVRALVVLYFISMVLYFSLFVFEFEETIEIDFNWDDYDFIIWITLFLCEIALVVSVLIKTKWVLERIKPLLEDQTLKIGKTPADPDGTLALGSGPADSNNNNNTSSSNTKNNNNNIANGNNNDSLTEISQRKSRFSIKSNSNHSLPALDEGDENNPDDVHAAAGGGTGQDNDDNDNPDRDDNESGNKQNKEEKKKKKEKFVLKIGLIDEHNRQTTLQNIVIGKLSDTDSLVNPNDSSLSTTGIGSGGSGDGNEETVSLAPGVYSNTKKRIIYLNDMLSHSKALDLLMQYLGREFSFEYLLCLIEIIQFQTYIYDYLMDQKMKESRPNLMSESLIITNDMDTPTLQANNITPNEFGAVTPPSGPAIVEMANIDSNENNNDDAKNNKTSMNESPLDSPEQETETSRNRFTLAAAARGLVMPSLDEMKITSISSKYGIKLPKAVPLSHIVYDEYWSEYEEERDGLSHKEPARSYDAWLMATKMKCVEIYKKYIAKGGDFKIRLSDETYQLLYDKMNNVNVWITDDSINVTQLYYCYNHAMREIYYLLNGSFQRFSRTKSFRKLDRLVMLK